MDFFDMNFCTLFLEKHGKLAFKDIEKHIIQESSIYYNHEYIEVIFKIAFLQFFGLAPNEIKKMIKDIMPGQQINVENLFSKHKKSISTIQKYLEMATKILNNK